MTLKIDMRACSPANSRRVTRNTTDIFSSEAMHQSDSGLPWHLCLTLNLAEVDLDTGTLSDKCDIFMT